jgi:hypothetical protein
MDRRQYQREWVANKRARSSRKQEIDFDTSDSDTADTCTSYASLLATTIHDQSATTAPLHTDFDMSSISSSDESNSESEVDCWDKVNQVCSKFSDSSDSDSAEERNRKCDLKGKLQQWAITRAVTHNQLDSLLPILHELDSTLPRTAKTLLKIDSETQLKATTISGGDYLYLGLKIGLIRRIPKMMKNRQLLYFMKTKSATCQ